ncbi:MAG TPA: FkbM family methyltransferase [Pirellulaceae bacterium]|nr:FkbM family methyltransferase [Pirellulaceae bacterium]
MEDCRPATNGELRFAQLLLPSCRIVFDVGARQDDDLVRLNAGCAFHLFEPSPKHCRALAEKVKDRSNVTVNPCAFGNARGTAWIYPDTESLVERAHSKSQPVPVTLTRLDDYCREHNIRQIDFLKIDTEGYELEVLKGGRDIVEKGTRVIQFEYGGTYADARITLRMVFDLLGPAWSFYRIYPDHLRPIRGYRPRLEDGRYANYVASRQPLSPAIVGPGTLQRLFSGARWWRKAS